MLQHSQLSDLGQTIIKYQNVIDRMKIAINENTLQVAPKKIRIKIIRNDSGTSQLSHLTILYTYLWQEMHLRHLFEISLPPIHDPLGKCLVHYIVSQDK